jgi:hypothetical protein
MEKMSTKRQFSMVRPQRCFRRFQPSIASFPSQALKESGLLRKVPKWLSEREFMALRSSRKSAVT